MKPTPEERQELQEAALPLMEWLWENCHPHCTVIVDSERAELVEGLAIVRRELRIDIEEALE